MEKLCKFISRLSMVIAAGCTGALAVVMVLQIFFRKVLNNSLSWSDEVGGYLLVWIAFFGAVTALYEGRHLNIDYFTSKMSGRGQLLIKLAADVLIIGLLAIIGWYSLPLIKSMLHATIISLNFPRWILYLVLPITAVFSIIILLNEMLKTIGLLRQKGENK